MSLDVSPTTQEERAKACGGPDPERLVGCTICNPELRIEPNPHEVEDVYNIHSRYGPGHITVYEGKTRVQECIEVKIGPGGYVILGNEPYHFCPCTPLPEAELCWTKRYGDDFRVLVREGAEV